MTPSLERWTAERSAELYGVREWGAGFFGISDKGELQVTSSPACFDNAVSIPEIIAGVQERGLDMPVLLRIENILDTQISLLNDSFQAAIQSLDYRGSYLGAYPIKVNQQQQVVEAVTRHGKKYHHGLEAGSKAELIAAMGMLGDTEAVLVCNGYKDEEFVDLGLHATQLGFQCILVVEMPGELPLIIERSKALGIKPILGVRVKLSSQANGLWAESGGDRSIFGLNVAQIIDVIDSLKEADMLDCLQLLHYHLGSQIPNIREIRNAVAEATRVYAGLVAEGAGMRYLDLGGGLAVDYDGTQTNFMSSRNYSVNEYCVDVVEGVMTVLDEQKIDHPIIITESGRALVAYYSMLLFNVLDSARFEPEPLPESLPEGTNIHIQHLFETLQVLNIRNVQECFNDILYYRDEVRQAFNHGKMTFRERALGDNVFWETINRIASLAKDLHALPHELEGITEALSDIYYCNFSVFQSLPDAWAIGQLFPVMPVHRLNEKPVREGLLADITCDCDGKIDRFIDSQGVKRTMRLHELKESEEYYLGAFLVGAYQETLGDLHNLLGDTNIVTVRIKENGEFDFVGELEGDTVEDILSYVEYDTKALFNRFRETAEEAVRQGRITPIQRRETLRAYKNGLQGYTYFER
ncbi:biosynthetic arginine decarboxylase [Pseudodesulfovibrio piezophilus]|uniref:Arginine decarboxylase n=1 Tax=Pseudodesulfovibrio piezophilus (strain DSM 21447 / JCM 15486 / C1TLV30) TaxID=1322246 RepID=M1WLI4_PSEP2|nr:biosynthetic arginine decarboxylase [Pseudodesulfovibrio piezophilus]CCH47920.1 Biosynthetic arginine decarboxylase [Pseudodesulfovibrio piezophilus C1TLV30]